MRIAIWHNLSSGGAKRVLHDQVRGLLGRGHRIEAWCPPTADRTFLPLNELVPERVLALGRPARRSDRLSVREMFTDQRADIAAMDKHCQTVASEIAAGGFEVLLAHCCTFYRATSVGRFANVPSILFAEPYRPLYEASPDYPWAAAPHRPGLWAAMPDALRDSLRTRSRRIQVREEIANAKAYDKLLAYSSYTRETILRSYGCDATVCYPGVDATRFRPLGLRRDAFVIGVGALCLEKNVELVVTAVARLRPEQRRVVWVADHVEPDVLRRVTAVARALSVSFELEHRVNESRLVDLLNRASVMAFAPRLEPLGLAPLEAAACELPVVAVGEAGVRETVVHDVTGLVTGPSESEFADAIGQLLDDPAAAQALGRAARKHVLERWSLDAAIERLERELLVVTGPGRRDAFTDAP